MQRSQSVHSSRLSSTVSTESGDEPSLNMLTGHTSTSFLARPGVLRITPSSVSTRMNVAIVTLLPRPAVP